MDCAMKGACCCPFTQLGGEGAVLESPAQCGLWALPDFQLFALCSLTWLFPSQAGPRRHEDAGEG